MSKNRETVLAIPPVDLKDGFFADLDYLGGVDYRFGWDHDKRYHSYVIVFRDGVRSNVRTVLIGEDEDD